MNISQIEEIISMLKGPQTIQFCAWIYSSLLFFSIFRNWNKQHTNEKATLNELSIIPKVFMLWCSGLAGFFPKQMRLEAADLKSWFAFKMIVIRSWESFCREGMKNERLQTLFMFTYISKQGYKLKRISILNEMSNSKISTALLNSWTLLFIWNNR